MSDEQQEQLELAAAEVGCRWITLQRFGGCVICQKHMGPRSRALSRPAGRGRWEILCPRCGELYLTRTGATAEEVREPEEETPPAAGLEPGRREAVEEEPARDLHPDQLHTGWEVFDPLDEEEHAALQESVLRNGILTPLLVQAASLRVIDGHHRLRLARTLGLAEVPVRVLQVDDEEAERLALKAQLARRNLDAEQKRALIARLIEADPAASNRRIAEAVGVHHVTVASVRDEIPDSGKLDNLSSLPPATVGADEVARPATAAAAEEQRERIAEAIEADPEKSNRAIAEEVGASHPTVATVRRKMTEPPAPPKQEAEPAPAACPVAKTGTRFVLAKQRAEETDPAEIWRSVVTACEWLLDVYDRADVERALDEASWK